MNLLLLKKLKAEIPFNMSQTNLYKTSSSLEKCILVAVALSSQKKWITEENLQELEELASTAGAIVVDKIIQERNKYDPAFFIGKGKAEQLALQISEFEVDLLIFDDELSPAQIRNLEQITDIKVIDRSALILDIFAAHAKSREARTQVELAQLNYLLPRLTRQWTHLSRQVGGIGTKGPGETQLETDRRLLRTRISYLNQELKNIEKQRLIQRKQQQEFIRAALVGYTNAGKSTLMNALTHSSVLIEDKLFATLDTTIRKLNIDGGIPVLLSDTVGFIRKLPHHLVASFRSTLAQTVEADILLHVIDISNPMYEEHILTVDRILKDLNISDKPLVMVFNKVDKIDSESLIAKNQLKYPNSVFVSAKKNIRIEKIKKTMYTTLKVRFKEKNIKLSYQQSHYLQKIGEIAHIASTKYGEQNITVQVRIEKENELKFNNLIKKISP